MLSRTTLGPAAKLVFVPLDCVMHSADVERPMYLGQHHDSTGVQGKEGTIVEPVLCVQTTYKG